MKKLISILLVAMLIIGMFPATTLTAFAADDTPIEFALGANGSAAHNDGSSKTSYTETVGDYTLNITGGTSMYTGARDAKGNSCIKLGTSSKTGEFSFTVPADVTSVIIAVGKYKTNTSKVTINGTTTTLTKSSNDGAYDDIEVDTTSNKTVTLTTVSGGVRAMVNTITFIIPGGSTEPDEPKCEHTNTELQDEAEATCTVDGYSGDEVCLDCGETVEEGEVIPALTHNYVDGFCERCGDPEPAAPEVPTDGYYKQVTDLADVTAGGKFVIVAAYGDKNYAMTLATTSKIPVVEVTVVGDSIVADDISILPGWIVESVSGGIALNDGSKYLGYGTSGTNFTSNGSAYTWTVTGSGTFRIKATTGSNRAVGFQTNGSQFGGYSTTNSSGYVFDLCLYKLVAGEAEVVESTLTFKELGAITMTETAEATKSYTMPAATNAAPAGYTFAGWVEAQLLGETAIAPETVYAAGDSYTVGNDATFYALYTRSDVQEGSSVTAYVAKDISEINNGDVVVITMTKNGTIYALPNNGGTSAPAANVTATVNDAGQLVADFDNILWDLNKDGDDLTFNVHGSTKDYLYCTNANNGVRVGSSGDAIVFNIDKGYLMNTQTTDPRYIGIYNTQDWRCYTLNNGSIASNIAGQTLTFYVKTSITGTVETTYYTTCVHSYASVSEITLACAYCGTEKAAAASIGGTAYETVEQALAAGGTVKLQAPATAITTTGDLVIDLNGNSIASLTTTGTLKAYDSKATTAAASGAKIESVNADEIVMDNTVGGVRYITLNDNGIYSFHALELTLTAVTLRTCGAGPNGASTNIPGAGLYYKAAIVCDPTLAAYVNESREECSFGLVLSLVNMPGSDFMTETENAYTVATAELESSKVFTSGILNNIFKNGLDAEENAARGKDNIYANAYLNLNGTIYMADTTADDTADAEDFDGAVFSLKTVMETLDESYNTLVEAQQTMLLDFYKTWQAAMSTWTLTNIAAAYAAQQPA